MPSRGSLPGKLLDCKPSSAQHLGLLQTRRSSASFPAAHPLLSVPRQANAYRTILTHFSSRYPTMPAFDWSTRHDVGIAMDFMSVNLCDLTWLPGMVRPLDELFRREAAGWEADDVEGAMADAAAIEPPATAAAAAAGVAPQAG